MILYCDTSALVKLYVRETDSDMVQAVAVDAPALEQARRNLARDWPDYMVVEVTQRLVELAGEYADTFALRAYDSVQLASAQLLSEGSPGEVGFACFDTRLSNAARTLGMTAIKSAAA